MIKGKENTDRDATLFCLEAIAVQPKVQD